MADASDTAPTKVPAEAPTTTDSAADSAAPASAPAPAEASSSTTDGVKIVPGEKPELKLIWLEKSRASRLTWLMEELELDYEIEGYERSPQMLAPKELKQYHPLGKSPILLVNGVALAESGAIVEFLIEHWGQHLKPKVKDSQAELDYRYYMHYAEGSLMPFLVLLLMANNIRESPVPFFIKPITRMIADKLTDLYIGPNIDMNFHFLEEHIRKTGWFAGDDFTACDVMMFFPLYMARTRSLGKVEPVLTKEKYPALWAYIDKIEKRRPYKIALQRTNIITDHLSRL